MLLKWWSRHLQRSIEIRARNCRNQLHQNSGKQKVHTIQVIAGLRKKLRKLVACLLALVPAVSRLGSSPQYPCGTRVPRSRGTERALFTGCVCLACPGTWGRKAAATAWKHGRKSLSKMCKHLGQSWRWGQTTDCLETGKPGKGFLWETRAFKASECRGI